VPGSVDDVTAAAFASPGMAAWKTVIWEGGAPAEAVFAALAVPAPGAGRPRTGSATSWSG
jgi:hypothetical protein